MSAKIFFLLTILGAAKAGFLGTPSVVVPNFGRRTTTVYHGSALSYHPNADIRSPQVYNEQYAVTTSPMIKAEDSDASDRAMASNSDGRSREDNFDEHSAFSNSNNQKNAERPRGKAQNEKMDERVAANENSGDGRYTSIESKASTTSPVSPGPTQTIPGGDNLVLVAAPAFYHATPVAYHTPLTYDTQVTYHGPIAHTAFSSTPNGKFAYSTSQISYGPNPSSLLEDCLTCPQTTSQNTYNQNQSTSLEDCLTCPQTTSQNSYIPQPTTTFLEDCLTCPQA